MIAEIVSPPLTSGDQSGGAKSPTYVRHVDDYWIGGHTRDEYERYSTESQASVEGFFARCKRAEDKIISTKFVFGETWRPNGASNFRKFCSLWE